MIEFLNYVPVEGSIGEFLMKFISAGTFMVFVTFSIWLVIREMRKSEDC